MVEFAIMLDSLMDQARRALREERNEDAQAILINVIIREPGDDEAWLLLASALTDSSKKQECLERARAINPRNPAILRALERLGNSNGRGESSDHTERPELNVREDCELSETTDPAETSAATSPSDLAAVKPFLDQGGVIAQSVMMTTDPPDTRSVGLDLLKVLDEASLRDSVRVQRWAVTAGRDALVKYEKALSSMIANLPRADPQLAALREQRQRLLHYLR